jgi:hypothetical protein
VRTFIVASLLAVAALLYACAEQKPPMTPDSPDMAMGDAGMEAPAPK